MKKFTLFVILLIAMFFLRGNAQNDISKRSTNGNELVVSVDTKDASEAGMNDGSIKLKVSGGQPPYTIHCFGPYSLPTQTAGSELKLEEIKSGDYLFVVQDKLKKSVVKEVKISNLK